MDKQAIELIQQSTTTDLLNNGVQEILEAADPAAAGIVLPSDFELVDLEKYMPSKRSFRGEFSSSMIDEAVTYTEVMAMADSRCFIDMENMAAKFIFDFGSNNTPLHGDNTGLLKLKQTAPYKQIIGVNQRPQPQREMAEWIEDNIDYLGFVNASGEEIHAAAVLAAVRNVTIDQLKQVNSSEGDWASERTAMEKISIKDTDNLPKFMTFTCNPYQGLEIRDITCRFSFTTSGDSIGFSLKIVNFEKLQEELADEFKTTLASKLDKSNVAVSIGNFSFK